jgi:hypothetical protein
VWTLTHRELRASESLEVEPGPLPELELDAPDLNSTNSEPE